MMANTRDLIEWQSYEVHQLEGKSPREPDHLHARPEILIELMMNWGSIDYDDLHPIHNSNGGGKGN